MLFSFPNSSQRWIYFLPIILPLLFCSLKAQAIPADSSYYDNLWLKAKSLAYGGDRVKAKAACAHICSLSGDPDASVLLGRLYAWEGQFDSARTVLKKVLKAFPVYYDAVDAMIDLEYWSSDPLASAQYCQLGLEKYADNRNFLLKKARIYNVLNKKQEAIEILMYLLKADQYNTEAKDLLGSILAQQRRNKISFTYNLDYFGNNERDPWLLVYAQYTRSFARGSLIGRLNHASRFNSDGWQYEADAYPSFGKKGYAYVNYGFSKDPVFPRHRFGTDYYYSFPRAYEGSAGFRYMDFSGTKVYILTAFIGKYIGDYWLSFRTFATPGNKAVSVSGSLLLRKYLTDEDHYLGLRIGYGKSPDDRRKQEEGQGLFLTSKSVRLEYSNKFFDKCVVSVTLMYENEEYITSVFRNIYTLNSSIAYLF
jgi:YaiO family outer membrane protein